MLIITFDGGKIVTREESSDDKFNIKSYLIISAVGAVLLVSLTIFVMKIFMEPEKKIRAKVFNQDMTLNQDLIYIDNTAGAQKWHWDFGNGDVSTQQDGKYRYKSAGTYVVRLVVNDNLHEQFFVTVKDSVTKVVDSTLQISGPSAGTILKEVRMEVDGPGEIYQWQFGESGKVDVIGKVALYTYSKPGRYRVKVKSDKTLSYTYHTLVIDGAKTDSLDSLAAENQVQKVAIDDLKAQLQAIADGGDFNVRYNYILNKFFCKNERTGVTIKSGGAIKQQDIYSYCIGLTFGGGVKIDNILLMRVPNSSCYQSLIVTQHK
ncbi:PKD domain-containing protein [Sphingobacterium spiritivorum]